MQSTSNLGEGFIPFSLVRMAMAPSTSTLLSRAMDFTACMGLHEAQRGGRWGRGREWVEGDNMKESRDMEKEEG